MSRRPESFRRAATYRLTAAIAAVTVALVVLSGCTQPGPTQPSRTTTASPTSSVAPTPTETTPPAPELIPDGSADDNLPFFASIVATVWAGPDQVSGRAYIDALAAAGFDKGAMQVTNDTSTVGNPAESIQFSVLWGGECLVGQVGPATGSPVAVVVPAVGDGVCLIGHTRPIDW